MKNQNNTNEYVPVRTLRDFVYNFALDDPRSSSPLITTATTTFQHQQQTKKKKKKVSISQHIVRTFFFVSSNISLFAQGHIETSCRSLSFFSFLFSQIN